MYAFSHYFFFGATIYFNWYHI
jgi:hypothetical protein